MTVYLVIGAASFACFAVLIAFRKAYVRLTLYTVGLLDVMLSELDEDLKQKKLTGQLVRVLISLGLSLAAVTVACSVAVAVLFGAGYLLGQDMLELDLGSWPSLLSMALGSAIPFLFMGRGRPDSAYSELSKLLHRIVLDNLNISKALFALEKRFFKEKLKVETRPFVIVSGLARSGTTAITTELHKRGPFYSLSYANMPFLMAPNLWTKLYKPKTSELTERAHGDNVGVGLLSVEALEEFFWKVQLSNSFILEHTLNEHEISDNAFQEYLIYQRLLAPDAEGGLTYLAKNNNMMLRYGSLLGHGADFSVILMFRKPVAHASSLLRQHRRFSTMQNDDGFVLEYMNWLGHHEFGLNQKQFKFSTSNRSNADKDSLEYWLELWIDYYAAICLKIANPNLLLVCYEDFLEEPEAVLKGIGAQLGLAVDHTGTSKFETRPNEADPIVNHLLLERADRLYEKLLENRLVFR